MKKWYVDKYNVKVLYAIKRDGKPINGKPTKDIVIAVEADWPVSQYLHYGKFDACEKGELHAQGYTITSDPEEVADFIIQQTEINGRYEPTTNGLLVKVASKLGDRNNYTTYEELDLTKHTVITKRPRIYKSRITTTSDPTHYQLWLEDDMRMGHPFGQALKNNSRREMRSDEIAFGEIKDSIGVNPKVFENDYYKPKSLMPALEPHY